MIAPFGDDSLKSKSFGFLIKLMGLKNQLRMNHWQTHSYAEHKWTDKLLGLLDGHIDTIGESVLGVFGRPAITTQDLPLSDIKIMPSSKVLDLLCEENRCMIEEYKVTEHEGVLALLGELDADIKKFKYLSTLE